MDNICETVFTYVTGHILTGKSLAEFELEETDYSYIQEMFMQVAIEDIKKRLESALEIFIKNYYEDDRELLDYTRYRYKLTSCRSSEKNRYQNALTVISEVGTDMQQWKKHYRAPYIIVHMMNESQSKYVLKITELKLLVFRDLIAL